MSATCEPKCHAYGIGCACRVMTPTQHPAPEVVALTDGERLAKIIWTASRADESTISATGANIVAEAILASDWLKVAVQAEGYEWHQTAYTERARAEAAEAERDTARREADDLRAQLGDLADEWETRAERRRVGRTFAQKFDIESGYLPDEVRAEASVYQINADRLRAALADPAAGMTEKAEESR